ncbi:unnamed protein product [Pedinophyceae sp. YPF-701]|nr:unnamed protein product [Pedinophyceae sp. YPF-701]
MSSARAQRVARALRSLMPPTAGSQGAAASAAAAEVGARRACHLHTCMAPTTLGRLARVSSAGGRNGLLAHTQTTSPAQRAEYGNRGFFGSARDSKKYHERKLLHYSPDQLYSVVSDVPKYSSFVPWCVGSKVVGNEGENVMLAELEVGFQMLSERYTSRVELEEGRAVKSRVVDSALFHHLDSTWRMLPGPRPGTAWLSFEVDFSFASPLHAQLAHVFFDEVVRRMMAAFEGRCAELYGGPVHANARRRAKQHG